MQKLGGKSPLFWLLVLAGLAVVAAAIATLTGCSDKTYITQPQAADTCHHDHGRK